MEWNDELLLAYDQDVLPKRLASIIAAGEAIAELRRKAAEAAMERLAASDLKPILERLNAFGDEYVSISKAIAAGDLSARDARSKLRDQWADLDRPEIRELLRPVFADFERSQASTSQERLEALFGKDATQRPWNIRHDWFGEYLYEPLADPASPKDDAEPVGVIRQSLDPDPLPPITNCSSTFDLTPRTADSAIGPGLSAGIATTPPGGGFFTFSQAVLLFVGGVGVQTQAAVGRSLRWPTGYSQLRVQATIDYRCRLNAYTVGPGVSTSSAELFVEAFVDNGPTVRVALSLGALVAPVAWGAEASRSDQAVLEATIALPRGSGSARLYAGAVSSAATGGVAISAGSTANTTGTVRSICATLS